MTSDVRIHIGRRRYASKPGARVTSDAVEWMDLTRVMSYSVTVDMLEPEDTFEVETPLLPPDVFRFLVPDAAVRVTIDGTVVLTGFIDRIRREVSTDGSRATISGRDKGGRLVDEAAPLAYIAGIGIKQLVERMALDWYDKVVLGNARNRALLIGKPDRNAQVDTTQPPIATDRRHDKVIMPGDTRWDVVRYWCEKADVLAFGSADGSEFIITTPNYEQGPSYSFVVPSGAGEDVPPGNAISMSYEESVAEMFAQYTVLGGSAGDGTRYHSNITRKLGRALDGPNADGTGARFFFPKATIIHNDDLHDAREATEWAARERALRLGTNLKWSIVASGHRQGGALFAPDTVAVIHDRQTFDAANYYVTRVQYNGSSNSQRTSIDAVPVGTLLSIA